MMKRVFRLALFQSEKMVVRMYNSAIEMLDAPPQWLIGPSGANIV